MRIAPLLPAFVLLCVLIAGCDRSEEKPEAPAAAAQPPARGEAPSPPAPPLAETFEGEPQLSLFPRVGAFRPENDDSQGLAFWETFIDHLLRTSGVAAGAGRDGGRAWAVKSIKGLDSVGFFSPLAVEPETTYRVRFAFRGELPEGASAGVGVLEFDEFLWVGDQFPRTLAEEHQSGRQEGVRLRGKSDWQEHAFTFTTSPRTRMVHLVLFREGAEDRKQPALFDDIRVEKAGRD